MKKPLLAALSLMMLVSACGTRLNPFNWFRASEPAAAAPVVLKVEDPRLLAEQITTLKVEPMPGGAIVRATALPPTQGWWSADLVAVEDASADGQLVYDFRLFPPLEQMAASTPRSRQITAAVFLSDIQLSTVRSITVRGSSNGLSSRR